MWTTTTALLTLLGQGLGEPVELRIPASALQTPSVDGWTRDQADPYTVRLTCAAGPASVLLYAYPATEWERLGGPERLFEGFRSSFTGTVVVQNIRSRTERDVLLESFEVPVEDGTGAVRFVSGVQPRRDRTVVVHATMAPGSKECDAERVLRSALRQTARR